MKLILFVLFVMTMFIWLLLLLGAFAMPGAASLWLPFFASLFLGIAVFLVAPGEPLLK